MSVTPLDPFENVPTNFAEVGQMLAWISQNLTTLQGLSGTYFDIIANSVGSNTGGSNSVTGVVTTLRTRLGDPGGSSNIDAKLNTIIANIDDAGDDVDELIDAVGHRTSGQIDLLGATQNIIDGQTVYHWAKVAADGETSIVNQITNTIGSILAARFGGGSDLITIGKWLSGIWEVPPIDVLSKGPVNGLAASTTLTIPAGVYGYHLIFTTPSYWGRLSTDPLVYEPHIAVAAWRGDYGTVGPVALLATPSSLAYPVPPGARYIDITIRPGITGSYEELRFLGL